MFINLRHGGISCHTLSIKCLLIRPDSPTVKVEKPSINILWWQKVISNYCANNLTVTQGFFIKKIIHNNYAILYCSCYESNLTS